MLKQSLPLGHSLVWERPRILFFCCSYGSWFKDETLETSVLCFALFKSLQDKFIPVVSGCNSVQASGVAPAYTKAKFGTAWIQINSTFGNKNENLGIFQHFVWNLITPEISLSNRFTAWKIFYSAINSVQNLPLLAPFILPPSSPWARGSVLPRSMLACCSQRGAQLITTHPFRSPKCSTGDRWIVPVGKAGPAALICQLLLRP